MKHGRSSIVVRPTYIIPCLIFIDPSTLLDGISAIPKSEAANLDGPTMPFASDPDKHIVVMDVFHLLHCLVSQQVI